MRYRRVTALAFAALLTAAPATAQTTISLKQAQAAAFQAATEGRLNEALALADAILVNNPTDSFAHMVRATVLLQGGHPKAAAPEARRAFRFAKTDRQKFEAARVAALSAARQDRFLPAQIWMRRAVQVAPAATDRARAVRDFRQVRRRARVGVQFGFSVAPSNNVNDGASDQYNVIDGVPLVGVLSGSALALPGTVSRGNVQLRYRLAQTDLHQTDLVTALQITRVALTSEARDKAPTVENSDFGSTYAEFGLRHVRAIGSDGALLNGSAHLGRVWSGGDISHEVARASLAYSLPVSETAHITISGTAQRQFAYSDGRADVDTGAIALGWRTRLSNRDAVTLRLGRSTSASDNPLARQTATTLTLGYQKADALGPVTLGGRLNLGRSHYADYAVGFLAVPGGRQDDRVSAEIDFGLTPLEYMGFMPTVTLSAEKVTSNVSRFETEELSLSVGFRSSF